MDKSTQIRELSFLNCEIFNEALNQLVMWLLPDAHVKSLPLIGVSLSKPHTGQNFVLLTIHKKLENLQLLPYLSVKWFIT